MTPSSTLHIRMCLVGNMHLCIICNFIWLFVVFHSFSMSTNLLHAIDLSASVWQETISMGIFDAPAKNVAFQSAIFVDFTLLGSPRV